MAVLAAYQATVVFIAGIFLLGEGIILIADPEKHRKLLRAHTRWSDKTLRIRGIISTAISLLILAIALF